MQKNRFYFEEVVANLLVGKGELQFYGYIIAQCKITLDKSFGAPAGVCFENYQYEMYVNPILFNKFNQLEKKAILIHEAMHIAFNHVTIRKHEEHERWNYAADIAINQLIDDIPKGCLTYKQFNLPKGLTAEEYYHLLENNEDFKKDKKEREKNKAKLKKMIEDAIKNGKLDIDSENTSEDGSELNIPDDIEIDIDSHSLPSEGDDSYREGVTKNILQKSMEKTRGTFPSNISEMISLYDKKTKVEWRRVLRTIVGNKKTSKRRTFKKIDRRFHNREDVKGIVKNTTFELMVILDVSGSMSNKEIIDGLNEIKAICKMTKSAIKIIQIDCEIKEVSDFTEKTKTIKRTGQGGTFLYPAIKYLKDNKIHYDGIVIITDMGIESIDMWDDIPKVPCIFLDTTGSHDNWDGFRYKNLKHYDIKQG